MPAASGASASTTPPAGRDHLAALAEAEPDRARVPEHRRRAREHADPLAAELDADERRHEALGHVEQRHRHAEPAPVDAPHVGGADVAAPLLADVLAAEEPDDDDAERDRPDQVAPGDDEGVLEHRGSV